MENPMSVAIKILDCTLRDGGFGFEDAKKNEISSLSFPSNDVNSMIETFPKTQLDIIELGSIEITKENKEKYCIYQNIESISKTIPKKYPLHQLYVTLFRGPDTPIDDIPQWRPGLLKGLRVIIRYSELQKSLNFCKALAQKGYYVFIQPMLTMRYTDAEINAVVDAANQMNAYAVYFVDSYGYMQEQDIVQLYKKYNSRLKPNIRIGFHAHNNMNLAFANALTFIKQYSDREIIIDACILGMGQGAGNLQTEIIASYMNQKYGTKYNFSKILELCEIIEKYYGDNLWGYSVTRLLPALHKTAYKFAIALRNKYKLSYVEIEEILNKMPDNMRQRYTVEDITKLLKQLGKI